MTTIVLVLSVVLWLTKRKVERDGKCNENSKNESM